jgi:hypothetical protein
MNIIYLGLTHIQNNLFLYICVCVEERENLYNIERIKFFERQGEVS